MKFFELNTTKGVVAFKNTGDLASQLNSVIGSLRNISTAIHPELGQFAKQKTPGKYLAKAAVRLALRNNGFNYKKREFQYQGKVGLITRPINAKINSKLRQTIPQPAELTEASIRILVANLLRKEHLPEIIIQNTSSAIAHAIIVGLIESGGSPSTSLADVKEAAVFAKQSALSAADVANELRKSPPDIGNYLKQDEEKNLILFENTDNLAENINKLIKQLRNTSGNVPFIGSELSDYVKKKTPGPKAVNLGIKQVLRNNAFNYKTMEFESQGRSIGTTAFINKKLNKKINMQFNVTMLKMETLLRHTYAVGIASSFLGGLPEGRLRDRLIYQLAEKIQEFTLPTEV